MSCVSLSSSLYSCGTVHRLQWLWQCRRCRRWLKPGRRQRLFLWQWLQPWRWLQFWQWPRFGGWPQLCWGQHFQHQIHHHLNLQQEGLQALKSSSWLLVLHCFRAPVQLHCPLLWLLLLSCLQFLGLCIKLRLPTPHFLSIPARSYLPLVTLGGQPSGS